MVLVCLCLQVWSGFCVVYLRLAKTFGCSHTAMNSSCDPNMHADLIAALISGVWSSMPAARCGAYCYKDQSRHTTLVCGIQ